MTHKPRFIAIEHKLTADNPVVKWSEHENAQYREARGLLFLVFQTLEHLDEDSNLLIIGGSPITERPAIYIETISPPGRWPALQVTESEVERWNRIEEAEITTVEDINSMVWELENIRMTKPSETAEHDKGALHGSPHRPVPIVAEAQNKTAGTCVPAVYS